MEYTDVGVFVGKRNVFFQILNLLGYEYAVASVGVFSRLNNPNDIGVLEPFLEFFEFFWAGEEVSGGDELERIQF